MNDSQANTSISGGIGNRPNFCYNCAVKLETPWNFCAGCGKRVQLVAIDLNLTTSGIVYLYEGTPWTFGQTQEAK